jgi:hypothetical protein
MQLTLDLRSIGDLDERRIVTRDFLAGAPVRPWTPAVFELQGGLTASGTHPRLVTPIPAVKDAAGHFLPEVQVLAVSLDPEFFGWASLGDVDEIRMEI